MQKGGVSKRVPRIRNCSRGRTLIVFFFFGTNWRTTVLEMQTIWETFERSMLSLPIEKRDGLLWQCIIMGDLLVNAFQSAGVGVQFVPQNTTRNRPEGWKGTKSVSQFPITVADLHWSGNKKNQILRHSPKQWNKTSWLGYIRDYTTQLCGNYFINHCKDP